MDGARIHVHQRKAKEGVPAGVDLVIHFERDGVVKNHVIGMWPEEANGLANHLAGAAFLSEYQNQAQVALALSMEDIGLDDNTGEEK